MSAGRVLVVDDEPGLRDLLREYLGAHGFEVATAADGRAFRAEMARRPPEVVVLDLNLGAESGHDLAREVAREGRAGVVMLTAAGELDDRLRGLAAGADDYVVKPFEPRELLARLRSVLRRVRAAPPPAPVGRPVGRAVLHEAERRLVGADGAEVPLTAMEFDLLLAFLRHPRQVLSRDRLSRLAHHRDAEPGARGIDVHVTRLRAKIEEDPRRPRLVVTVRGEGYRFEPNPVAGPDKTMRLERGRDPA